MRNRAGFTIVEVMAASLIAGILFLTGFSCLRMGYKVLYEKQDRETANMIGDKIFELAVNELRTAEEVMLCDEDPTAAVDEEAWMLLYGEMFSLEEDVFIYAESKGENLIELTVRLERKGKICYERTDTFLLLNVKNVYGDSGSVILYQNIER